MEDVEIVTRINTLVGDYRRLERQHGGLGLTVDQRKVLSDIQEEIDRNWAVLRQRRARRDIGADPEVPVLVPGRGVKSRRR